jgi:hypothetical protein
MPRLVDLSHPVAHGLITDPGLPAPVVGEHVSREASRGLRGRHDFPIGRSDAIANTAPFHRLADGADRAGLALESLANLPGRVGVRAMGTFPLRAFAIVA